MIKVDAQELALDAILLCKNTSFPDDNKKAIQLLSYLTVLLEDLPKRLNDEEKTIFYQAADWFRSMRLLRGMILTDETVEAVTDD